MAPSFEESERNDPERSWISKEPLEELSSETTSVTDEFVEELRTVYDHGKETIRSEKKVGICSVCGCPVTQKSQARCFYGCQTCDSKSCSPKYNGRRVCRRHVESRFGNIEEAILLLGLKAKLGKSKIKKLGNFSENQFGFVLITLEEKGYIQYPFNDILNTPKLTPAGNSVLPLLLEAYSGEYTFRSFILSLGVRYV